MRDFLGWSIAAGVKWFILFTAPAFAIDMVLKEENRILLTAIMAVLAVVGAYVIAFRLERFLVSKFVREIAKPITDQP